MQYSTDSQPSPNPRDQAWQHWRGGPVVVFRWVNSPGWPVEYVTPNVHAMFGCSVDDLVSGKVPYASLVHPEDLERVGLEVEEAVRLGLEHFEQAYRFLHVDGRVRHLCDYTVVKRNDVGEVTHFEGYVYDDTERQQAEESLRDEEEDSRNLVRIAEILAGDLTFQDLCFHALEAMKAYADLWKASLFLQRDSEPHLLERIAMVSASPNLEERVRVDLRDNPWYQDMLYAQEPIFTPDVAVDGRCIGPEFERADLRSLIVIPMNLAGGKSAYLSLGNRSQDPEIQDSQRLRRFLQRLGVLLATAMDRVDTLMQRHAIEEHLHHAHKMEAVGLLAGGVAHNFNNTLTVILGYTSMLLAEGGLEESVRAKLLAVFKAGESSAVAVRQLLEFSRKQKAHDPQPIDVGQVVESLEIMLRPLIGERLQLSVEREDNLGYVFLEPGELEMILMNLAVNAKDAVQDKGQLHIRAFRQEDVGNTARLPFIVLEVEDDGDGLSEEVQRRLFEPFFTTKEEGHGTGLGLSAVYGVVQRAGGTIEVESERGHGTMFRMRLPQRAVGDASARASSADSRAPHGVGHILLVEDQAPVRRLAAESLRAHGYEVLVARDGEEALALLADNDREVDLLLSDVVMPRMDGLELCRRFATMRPHVPLLLMSGFVDRVFPGAHHEAQGIPLLRKPFTTAQLLDAVAQALLQA